MSVNVPCFIELTNANSMLGNGAAGDPGAPVWLNMSLAARIKRDGEVTLIHTPGGILGIVKETPEEIIRKIVRASVQVEIRT